MSRRKPTKGGDGAGGAGLHGSGRTTSPWMDASVFEARPLSGTIEADVCVLGAGVAGLTAAYQLAREGKSVVVLEDGEVAGGETARSTAHLSTALGDRYHRLEEAHGEPAARLIAESHASAIDFIERTVEAEAVDCGFRRLNGYLFWPSDGDLKELDLERAACERAGLEVETLESAPLDFWNSGPCLLFPRQAQLDPVRYASGLARAAARHGVTLFSRSRGRILSGRPLRVRAGGGLVIADSVVVATNAPIDDRVTISARQAAYRTYALAAEWPAEACPPMLLWDTVDPYHYVRFSPAKPGRTVGLILVGGEDHKVGHACDAEERWARLEAWARSRFSPMGAVVRRWSGQVQKTADGIAYIGRHPMESQPVYVITGDCGSGMTHGTLGGMLVADQIAGRANDWGRVYDPARLPAGHAYYDLARENLDAAAQYFRYAAAADVVSADQVPPGCGAVLWRGLNPVAVYRAEDGALLERSAICPHLGGLLCWNQAERTWDCPVHGSRFSPAGEPLTGPANDALGTPENPLPQNPIIRAWTPPPSS